MGLINVIESSILATSSEGTMQSRKIHVKEVEPAYKRVIAQSIDIAIFAIPATLLALDRAAMHRHGYTFVGSGVEARVYSDGTQVTKYVGKSERLSSSERRDLRDRKRADFDLLHHHMSSFVLDQTISVAPHVLRQDREIVQTVQPHAHFSRLMERIGVTGDMRMEATGTSVLDELSDFVDASWQLFGSTGLLPDINGPDNVVRVEDSVLLLDTQPISDEVPGSQELIQRQLGSISTFIDRMS